MPLRKVYPKKTVAAASGVFRDVCSEEPPYHTAEELWDEGARLLFVLFLRVRKNERRRCSVEKAVAAEGKRWVGVLIEVWGPTSPVNGHTWRRWGSLDVRMGGFGGRWVVARQRR